MTKIKIDDSLDQDKSAIDDVVKDALDIQARKFAALLASSDVDQNVQDALVASLQYLSLEQILHLVNLLEAKHSSFQMQNTEQEVIQKIQKIVDDFLAHQDVRDKELISKINALATT